MTLAEIQARNNLLQLSLYKELHEDIKKISLWRKVVFAVVIRLKSSGFRNKILAKLVPQIQVRSLMAII